MLGRRLPTLLRSPRITSFTEDSYDEIVVVGLPVQDDRPPCVNNHGNYHGFVMLAVFEFFVGRQACLEAQ